MSAEIIKIDPADPAAAFSICKRTLRSGGIIVYPTDTFYGLGADPSNAEAVKQLFKIKGRQTDQPILLLVKDARQIRDWASEISPQAEQLMNAYWPGPLTLVFKAKEHVLPELTAGKGTIGLRVPGSRLTLHLLEFVGAALTGTSANVSGKESFSSAREAAAAIGDKVDLIVDGGLTPGGLPSTVIDVSSGRPRLLRQGAIQVQNLL